MNGNHKWHKATGPAFNPGEQWISHAGNSHVTIVSVRKYPGASPESNYTSDYGVTYAWGEGDKIVQHEKDAWCFQVRYGHIADRNLK
jgi:hypothetical protein